MAQEDYLRLLDFSGGLNEISQKNKLKNNESPLCYNYLLDNDGSLKKRNGMAYIADLEISDKITGLYLFHEKDGTRHLIATAGSYIYEIDENEGTYEFLNISVNDETFTADLDTAVGLEYNKIESESVTVTSTDGNTTYIEGTDYTIDYENGTITCLTSGSMNNNTDYLIDYYHAYNLTPDLPMSFTTWGNICYMSNGTDDLLEFDGTEVIINENAPKGKYIVAHNNILFIAGNSDDPSFVFYSDIGLLDADGSGNNWTDGDGNLQNFKVSTDDGDVITGITKLQSNLVIFKSNSIHVLYGDNPNNFQLRENVVSNIGCIAPMSLVNVFNRLIFLYRDGFYSFDGSTIDIISKSENVKPSIEKIIYPKKCSGAIYDNKYIFSYPEGSSEYNNKTLVYDISHQSWYRLEGLEIEKFNNFDGSQDGQVTVGEIYFGSSSDSKIYKYDNKKNYDEKIYYESITSSYDTWVDLTKDNLILSSFSITGYEENTDYEVDYKEGSVKVLSTGSMSDSTAYDVKYKYKKDIDTLYYTKYFNMGREELVKTIRAIMVDSLAEGKFKLTLDIDRGATTREFDIVGSSSNPNYKWGMTTWDDLIWHIPESNKFSAGVSDAHGKNIRFIFSEKSINNVKVNSLICKFRLLREDF